MITIKDVARKAGVSVTSASYALNGTGTISEETRRRVLTAAEELNYHPNAYARNLKNRKALTLGVFITRFGGSFYEDILEGIHDAILKTDYDLIVCPESRAIRRVLTQRMVDGAIVFDSKVKSDTLLKLASSSFPVVVLDRYLNGQYIHPLLVDNQHGVRQAFQHLVDQGARKLSFVSGASDSFDNAERMTAFLDEASKHHIGVTCIDGAFTEESGYAAGLRVIASGSFPDGVFCANDQMAIGFIKALQENHLRVPEDTAVVGFDDILITRYMQPSLTTIGASRLLWGSLAATQLIDFLEKGTPFQPYRIQTELIIRESSLKHPIPTPV